MNDLTLCALPARGVTLRDYRPSGIDAQPPRTLAGLAFSVS